MRQTLLTLLAGIILIALQGVIRTLMAPSAFVPNLILPLVLFLAFYHKGHWAVLVSFLLGLEYDLFASRQLLGPNAGAYVVTFGVVSSFSQRLFLESFVTVMVTTFLANLLSQLVYLSLVGQFFSLESLDQLLLAVALPESFVTAIVAPMLFPVFRRVSSWRARFGTERSRRSISGRYQRVI